MRCCRGAELKSLPGAVRSAVVYGPNASGKSTLLEGLNYLRAVVAEFATVIQPGQTYNVQPNCVGARPAIPFSCQPMLASGFATFLELPLQR